MHLPRHTIESHATVPLFINAAFSLSSTTGPPSSSASKSSPFPSSSSHATHYHHAGPQLSDPSLFACATSSGFLIAQCEPLKVVARRSWPAAQGGLSHAVPVGHSSLLVLVGGGRIPRFAPNKVVLWDERAEYVPAERSKRSSGKQRASSDPAGRRRAGADDDDNITLSRHASTVFSAGSKFDSVVHTLDFGHQRYQADTQLPQSSDDHMSPDDDWDRAASASLPDSLRFSRTSLVGAPDDLNDVDARSISPSSASASVPTGWLDLIGQPGATAISATMEASLGASSIGIGRLQDDFAEVELSSELESSVYSSRSPSQHPMQASSASIMASSADLDDPFALDEPRSNPPSPPPPVALPAADARPHDHASSTQGVAAFTDTAPLSTHHHDSLSSLHQSVHTPQDDGVGGPGSPSPKVRAPVKGREVAELEFGELVRGIRVATVAGSAATASQAGDGRQHDGAASTILVVLLSSKAVIFELLHKPNGCQGPSCGWTIAKRAAVDTYKNVHGLGAVAPLSPSPAVVVAVPGRQKGHVQIVHLRTGPGRDAPAATVAPSRSTGNGGMAGRHANGASTIIVAHESSIAALALSPCGKLLATASSKGTLLRIWSSVTGTKSDGRFTASSSSPSQQQQGSKSASASAAGRTGFGATLVRELRRGTDPARILGMAFAPDGSAIAAASDKGTVHVFQLMESAGSPARSPHPSSPSLSSPSLSSPRTNSADSSKVAAMGGAGGRTSGTAFGSTAYKYLPSSLGQLANHIPASMLPQYFKSEWSGAQFRVPLKTFGADSRAPLSTNAFFGGGGARSSDAGSDSDDDAEGKRMGGSSRRREAVRNLGTEKSTDGAWAAMKGRLEDIRKGEPGVDEKVFLCWVTLPEDDNSEATGSGTAAATPSNASSNSGRARRETARGTVGAAAAGASAPSAAEVVNRDRFRLIILTTSGAWYKVALQREGAEGRLKRDRSGGRHDSDGGDTGSSMVLDMYREDLSASKTKARGGGGGAVTGDKGRAKGEKDALRCELEEYRRFGDSVDGWEF